MLSNAIIGIVGPEGGGKTCLMAYLSMLHVAQGGKLLTFPGFDVTNSNGKKLSQTLETEKWITMAPELRDVLICIDEIQNFFNSLKHMSTLNYLFANLSAQRRHRNIGIIYTVQDWAWLDNRIRWLTHTLATCYDLYWSPWGKEQELERGELISVTFYDVKGFFTGKPWTPSSPFTLKAKSIWPCYDSWCDVDIFEGMAQLKIKKPTYTINLNEPAGGEPGPGQEGMVPPGPDDSVELLNELANTGVPPTLLSKVARRVMGGNG